LPSVTVQPAIAAVMCGGNSPTNTCHFSHQRIPQNL
jgi:hypothetical protein